jgi:hypothetical protein
LFFRATVKKTPKSSSLFFAQPQNASFKPSRKQAEYAQGSLRPQNLSASDDAGQKAGRGSRCDGYRESLQPLTFSVRIRKENARFFK